MTRKVTKQTLLPFHEFHKAPSDAALKKHNHLLGRLNPQAKNTTPGPQLGSKKVPNWIKKMNEKKKRDDKALKLGSKAWQDYLYGSHGVNLLSKWDTQKLYLEHGPPPMDEANMQELSDLLKDGSTKRKRPAGIKRFEEYLSCQAAGK